MCLISTDEPTLYVCSYGQNRRTDTGLFALTLAVHLLDDCDTNGMNLSFVKSQV